MKITQYICLVLLLVSLLGDWGGGEGSGPLLMGLAFPSYPGPYEGLFNMIVLLITGSLLLFFVLKSGARWWIDILGMFISFCLLLFVVSLTLVGYNFSDWGGGQKDILSMGYGPFLAILSLAILFLSFLRYSISSGRSA